jgi:hypothetical protein
MGADGRTTSRREGSLEQSNGRIIRRRWCLSKRSDMDASIRKYLVIIPVPYSRNPLSVLYKCILLPCFI